MMLLAIACLGQLPLGPLDAFKANYGATKVEAIYTYKSGSGTADTLKNLREWSGKEVAYVEDSDSMSVRWACDGNAEVLKCEELAKFSQSDKKELTFDKTSRKAFVKSKISIEVLTDGWIQAEHRSTDGAVQIHINADPGLARLGRGPYMWWGSFRFPSSIKTDFEDASPSTFESSLGGYKTIVSVYQKNYGPGGGDYRVEIHFDPSIGYLPRFARSIGVSGKNVYCKELYLIEAKSSTDGGFVPTEYFDAAFSAAPVSLPSTSVTLDFKSIKPLGTVKIGHLQNSKFSSLTGPVAITNLEMVKVIAGRGGFVPLSSKSPLTIDQIKSSLGKKLTDAKPTTFATSDLPDAAKPVARGWNISALQISLIIVVVLALSRVLWKRIKKSTLIMILCVAFGGLSGCSRPSDSEVKVEASFDRSQQLIEGHSANLHLSLIIVNQTNTPIKVFKVDGNCSCRAVDQSVLPSTLSPGAKLVLGDVQEQIRLPCILLHSSPQD